MTKTIELNEQQKELLQEVLETILKDKEVVSKKFEIVALQILNKY